SGLVAAEPGAGKPPAAEKAPEAAAPEAPAWMNVDQIVTALREKTFTRKVMGAFHLYKQPALNDPKLLSPLYDGWRGARKQDKFLFETCMRRLGKPMVDHLLAEYKKDPKNHYIYEALGLMGDQVKSLAPTLARNILRGQHRNESIRLLGKIGPAALPYAKKLLVHRNHIVRADGMGVMEALGPLGAAEWRGVVRVEMMEKETVPYYGLKALAAMGPEARGALPWVFKCLKHHRDMTRRQALVTLARISPNHRLAVSALNKQLSDRRPDVRVEGLKLLRTGNFSPKTTETALARALKDRDASVRAAALLALRLLENQPKSLYASALPLGDGLFKDNNKAVLREYFLVASKAGPKGADRIADFLIDYIGTKDHYHHVEETRALLRRMGREAAHVIPKLETAIEKARYPHQKDALQVTIFVLRHADWPQEKKAG
ncbi:MAG: hypothetical protein R3236_10530, partial [Phycisphaeraceae bacterium]|nr:hypothetical protein [Phycisphaeraceae bacterium]